ncbi:MAG: Ribosomal RNA small subunit methyltransferase H [Candidatus Uhrbacteria bacterium GW2011_GWF2_39_13]|uniref:Ribosomal RNA small subunit methyltransferase H n=1 Tax=Candidatus Uhrbacteria bacterium GW2011_GWF2_39_13 TaxID=1618995 RepID=A0A0G0MPJ0_9BACT|nr:MAG: Ribosomal RNA small subunit methyltransferase H [Candidatus Uhrbacteria bacterium GW2011_GWF2_39_13]HAU65954.1 16S rRNA (cytosine(1402)-N(4))-methyltransferase [Candidatus Uhrbacteria bacterium]
MEHKPVLLTEVSNYLRPEPNHFFIDGTVGLGGHAATLLSQVLPGGRLLGIDRDAANLERAKKHLSEFEDAVVLVCDSYANIRVHAQAYGFNQVHGILLDLGFSSVHVDDPERGFSFKSDGPLDMRYDRTQSLTAEEIINSWSEDDLARIFRQYGEERQARLVAQAIIKTRAQTPFRRTHELAELVAHTVHQHGKIHPATQVFQALRIAVNDELGELQRTLPECVNLLASGGRLAIISFHSLEDRMIKQFFKTCSDLKVLTKRPVVPTRQEQLENSRSRSAKLRVAEKI